MPKKNKKQYYFWIFSKLIDQVVIQLINIMLELE